MSGTLLFVHGTGVRNVADAMRDIRERAARILGWREDQVRAIEWGLACGPPDLDIRPALPPEDATKGIGDDASDAERDAELWELLLVDPGLELRILAEGPRASGGLIDPTDDPPDVLFRNRILALHLPDEALQRAGLAQSDVAAACTTAAADPTLPRAAAAVGDADDEQLVEATARALVATMLRDRGGVAEPNVTPPAAAYDDAARDGVLLAIESALVPVGAKGIGGDVLKKVMSPLLTRLAVSKRADFMDPLSDFMRDVTFYTSKNGAKIRAYIAKEVRAHPSEGPVVILAHSLGGIAAVDMLADPAEMEGSDALRVDLLVTVGSQAPVLYLLDSLASLSPTQPDKQPFVPWLNIYNRQDLLSFCAARVFVNARPIDDEPVAAGVPFPMSHSAYWTQDRVYDLIHAHLPQ